MPLTPKATCEIRDGRGAEGESIMPLAEYAHHNTDGALREVVNCCFPGGIESNRLGEPDRRIRLDWGLSRLEPIFSSDVLFIWFVTAPSKHGLGDKGILKVTLVGLETVPEKMDSLFCNRSYTLWIFFANRACIFCINQSLSAQKPATKSGVNHLNAWNDPSHHSRVQPTVE